MKNNKFLNFLINVFKGGLIGIAAVIPGFSGGTIACIVGVYDDIIEAISGIRKHFKQSVITLLPYILGILLFAIALIVPITWGINNYPLVTISLFAGLLLGGIPSFYKNVQGHESLKNFMWGIFGFLIVLAIVIPSLFSGNNYISLVSAPWYMYIVVLLMGCIAASALVIPGISGSMVLLIIGFYNPIMDVIKGFIASCMSALGKDISMDFASQSMLEVIGKDFIGSSLGLIICFGIGIVIGFIIISKIMKYLLSKHRVVTYFVILGFIIGSLVGIYANGTYYLHLDWIQIVLALVCLVVGFILSFYMAKLANKKTLTNNNNEDTEDVAR